MRKISRTTLVLAAVTLGLTVTVPQSRAETLPAETPQNFRPTNDGSKPSDFQKAQRIYHAPGKASSVELPVVTMR